MMCLWPCLRDHSMRHETDRISVIIFTLDLGINKKVSLRGWKKLQTIANLYASTFQSGVPIRLKKGMVNFSTL